jgi:hypothetical protein
MVKRAYGTVVQFSKVAPCLRRSGYAQAGLKLLKSTRPFRFNHVPDSETGQGGVEKTVERLHYSRLMIRTQKDLR